MGALELDGVHALDVVNDLFIHEHLLVLQDMLIGLPAYFLLLSLLHAVLYHVQDLLKKHESLVVLRHAEVEDHRLSIRPSILGFAIALP